MLNSIDISSSSEGPAHDPYAVEHIMFTNIHNDTHYLKCGSLSGLTYEVLRDGAKDWELICSSVDDDEPQKAWEEATGLTVKQAQKIHYRFWEPDPFGCPADYI